MISGTFSGLSPYGNTGVEFSNGGYKIRKVFATDNGHPERAFFQKFKSFGLGQTNWAEILGCILVISNQTIGTILAL